jgi:hypothetical protein
VSGRRATALKSTGRPPDDSSPASQCRARDPSHWQPLSLPAGLFRGTPPPAGDGRRARAARAGPGLKPTEPAGHCSVPGAAAWAAGSPAAGSGPLTVAVTRTTETRTA